MESFESYRPYLFSIAYRTLGSAMDAEDLVQETYLRAQSAPPETIRSLKAFLTTTIIRLCMDPVLPAFCREPDSPVGAFWFQIR